MIPYLLPLLPPRLYSSRLAMIKNEKKAKEREKKEMEAMNRKHLANMRVVQKSLVYVIGLPPKLANDEVRSGTHWASAAAAAAAS